MEKLCDNMFQIAPPDSVAIIHLPPKLIGMWVEAMREAKWEPIRSSMTVMYNEKSPFKMSHNYNPVRNSDTFQVFYKKNAGPSQDQVGDGSTSAVRIPRGRQEFAKGIYALRRAKNPKWVDYWKTCFKLQSKNVPKGERVTYKEVAELRAIDN